MDKRCYAGLMQRDAGKRCKDGRTGRREDGRLRWRIWLKGVKEAPRHKGRTRVRGASTREEGRGRCWRDSRRRPGSDGKGDGEAGGVVLYGGRRKKGLTLTLSLSLFLFSPFSFFSFFSSFFLSFLLFYIGDTDVWWGVDIAQRGLAVLWAVSGRIKWMSQLLVTFPPT